MTVQSMIHRVTTLVHRGDSNAERGDAMASRLSVCLSVTFRYRDCIGWNSSKIISRPNTLTPMCGLTPTRAIRSTETPPKLGWNTLCLCEIIPCVLLT